MGRHPVDDDSREVRGPAPAGPRYADGSASDLAAFLVPFPEQCEPPDQETWSFL